MNCLFEACRVKRPWQLCVESTGAPLPQLIPLDQPFAVVGQAPDVDLCLAHKDVSARHAFLQWIRGRLHVLDLGSRTGILWDGRRQRTGWLDPGQSLRIGPYRLALPADESSPSAPDEASLPALVLDIKLRGIRSVTSRVEGALTILGSAADCEVRLLDPTVSTYHCAIVNTPRGSWAVDLLGAGGVTANGQPVRSALLEKDDVIAVGRSTVRVADIDWSERRVDQTPFPAQKASAPAPAPGPEAVVPAHKPQDELEAALPVPERNEAFAMRLSEPQRESAGSRLDRIIAAVPPERIPEPLGDPAPQPAPEPRRIGFFAPWRRTPLPNRPIADPSPAEMPLEAPQPAPALRNEPAPVHNTRREEPAPSRARRDDPAPTTPSWSSSSHYEPSSSGSPGSDRRASCRYPIDGRSAQISWWTVAPTPASHYRPRFDDASERDVPQNQTVSVSIVDISQAGLAVVSPVSPPLGERVWFRLDQELSLDWIELIAVGSAAAGDGNQLVRFSFRETCPYDLFKSLVFSAGSARP